MADAAAVGCAAPAGCRLASAVLAGLGLQHDPGPADARWRPSSRRARWTGCRRRAAHISLLTGDLQALPLELDAIYRYMIDECGDAIAAAIKVLAAADALPALVHCSAGKDRTGIVVALILAVLGVPDEVIAADYALSARYLDTERTPAIGQLQASTGLGDEPDQAAAEQPARADTRRPGQGAGSRRIGRRLPARPRPERADLDRLRAALARLR